MNRTCTVLILTYKGLKHLELLLPTIKNAIENTVFFSFEVLIVDNGKDKETSKYVNSNFPEYRIEPAPSNDYLFSLNDFVANLTTPFVFILNDDMKLEAEVLNKIMPLISNDESLFSVGCNVLNWEGTETTVGVRKMNYQKGWMRTYFEEIKDRKLRYTLYGGGGAAVFRTSYFNELNGFNELYRPAYCEDLDLGHRAWRKGWKSILHPEALLYHRDGATIKQQFTSDALEQKILKNQLLWMIRNVRINGFLFYFFLFLPVRLLKWKKLNQNLYIAFKMAVPKLGLALKQRIGESPSMMSDEKIMNYLNKEYEIGK